MLQLMWGWQPALYLFLGGMGAGAFVMAALLYLIDRDRHAKIICWSMWGAVAGLVIGLLLLLSELTNPLRGLLMWQSFGNFTSWMTYEAWGAFLAIAVFMVSAILATKGISTRLAHAWSWFAKRQNAIRKILAIVGIALGAFVAVYTGMLLMTAAGIPLWNTPLLPLLFAVSAFDTGVALVEIVAIVVSKREGLAPKARQLLERIVVVLVVVECVVLAVFLTSMLNGDTSSALQATAAESASLLVSGVLAPYFWGLVVVCGLIVPLAMALVGLVAHKKENKAFMAIGALGALIGGCELRFLMLAAGLHANLLADAVALAVL